LHVVRRLRGCQPGGESCVQKDGDSLTRNVTEADPAPAIVIDEAARVRLRLRGFGGAANGRLLTAAATIFPGRRCCEHRAAGFVFGHRSSGPTFERWIAFLRSNPGGPTPRQRHCGIVFSLTLRIAAASASGSNSSASTMSAVPP
jgi:hypothetical protein